MPDTQLDRIENHLRSIKRLIVVAVFLIAMGFLLLLPRPLETLTTLAVVLTVPIAFLITHVLLETFSPTRSAAKKKTD
jgi:hypothetical protein